MVLEKKEKKKKVAIETFYRMNDSGLYSCLKPFSGLLLPEESLVCPSKTPMGRGLTSDGLADRRSEPRVGICQGQ